MALLQRLELRQGQALVMTPQLLQAIKLLQLSHLDLAAYVEAELERNPLLERVEGDDAAPDERPEVRDEDGRDGEPEDGAAEGESWLAHDLEPSRSALEGDFDTPLDDV